ncbi:hypothetical protein LCGC14_0547190 [marine sediment metagenome]|uniref:Uncharacterized protein n=1 Tax=marine sediment metagenome TaxID=412755 RepID=A0A0F9S9I0_9ZZZZ
MKYIVLLLIGVGLIGCCPVNSSDIKIRVNDNLASASALQFSWDVGLCSGLDYCSSHCGECSDWYCDCFVKNSTTDTNHRLYCNHLRCRQYE